MDKTRLDIALQTTPILRDLRRIIVQINGQPIPVQWIHATIVVACLALATMFRVLALDTLGFNSDEAVYAGQAAAIANAPNLNEIFPIFRAHPLLYQYMIALAFQISVSDILARIVAALIGVATILIVYRLGKTLYDPWVGILAAFFMAVMPYHVVVSRQVLLDGPMTLFATLTLYFMVRFAETERPVWLYAAGATMGLTMLSKETGVVFIASIFIFLALSPWIRVRIRDVIIAVTSMALIFASFPLTLALAGGGGSQRTQQYLVWQLLRRPNHTWDFYLANVTPVIGPLLILISIFGLIWLRKKWSWRETLLTSWIVVPAIFFELWPTKGFQYLLPIVPAITVLAGRTIRSLVLDPPPIPRVGPNSRAIIGIALTALVAISLIIPTWQRIYPSASAEFLAGGGGLAGGREAGLWIRTNLPENATLMTIGPSMGNILQFYGYRKAMGLSVSPNPLRRNPSYQPIHNPDFQIRSGEIQYLVWDAFSARRSFFFSEKLLEYARKYNGRVIHTESVSVSPTRGQTAQKLVIVIYEVHP